MKWEFVSAGVPNGATASDADSEVIADVAGRWGEAKSSCEQPEVA